MDKKPSRYEKTVMKLDKVIEKIYQKLAEMLMSRAVLLVVVPLGMAITSLLFSVTVFWFSIYLFGTSNVSEGLVLFVFAGMALFVSSIWWVHVLSGIIEMRNKDP